MSKKRPYADEPPTQTRSQYLSMSFQKSLNPIIYHNPQLDVFLIDIPRSISTAQGTYACPVADSIISCPPVETPYVIKNEPKSAKAIKQMRGTAFNVELHAVYMSRIESALKDIRDHGGGAWCLPRRTPTSINAVSRATSADPDTAMEDNVETVEPLISEKYLKPAAYQPPSLTDDSVDKLMSSLCSFSTMQHMGFPPTMETMALHRRSSRAASPLTIEEPWESPLYNDRKIPMQLTVKNQAGVSNSPNHVFKFSIPPLSKLMLDDFNEPNALRDSIRTLGEQRELPQQFDFIIVDPPWPNKSAKRKQSYTVEPSVKGIKRRLSNMKIETVLAPGGIVAVWVTNKTAIREAVTGSGGLFERMNIELKEEWIWIKTTTTGDPIFDLNSNVRKPYEVLLLGKAPVFSPQPAQGGHSLIRRVMAGVPDLHSRKPCLKPIIESLLPPDQLEHHNVLEIFARHLVSGWWSWGNEVLKFNWEGHWSSYYGYG